MNWLKKILIGVMGFMLVSVSVLPVMAAENQIEVGLKGKDNTYKAGKKAALTLTIKNNGEDLSNITICPVYSNNPVEWPFKEMDEAAHKKTIGQLDAGTSTDVAYHFTTRDDVGSTLCKVTFLISGAGERPIEFTVFPFTQEAEKKGDVQKVEIMNRDNGNSGNDDVGGSGYGASYDAAGVLNAPASSGGESSDGSVPRVIVTGFTTDPANVKAGSDFKLVVHLKNTSKKTAVCNMVVDLSSPTEGTDES